MFDPIDDKTIQLPEWLAIAAFTPLAIAALMLYVAYLAAGAIGIVAVLAALWQMIAR